MTDGEIKCLRKLQPGQWQEFEGWLTALWSLHASGLVRTRPIPDEQLILPGEKPLVSHTNQKYEDDRREWILTPEGETARTLLPPVEEESPGIKTFQGPNRFLSNFWPANVVLDEVTYPSVEHAYQAAKTLDKKKRAEVLKMTPSQSKKFGKSLTIRPDWDAIKLDLMYDLVRQKFQHQHLKVRLLETSGELQEGNTWGDTFWGVCRGQGENHLGKILMRVREELKGT